MQQQMINRTLLSWLSPPAFINIFTVEKALKDMAKLDTLGDSVMFVFGNTKEELLEFSKQHQFDEVNMNCNRQCRWCGTELVDGSSIFLTEEGKKIHKNFWSLEPKSILSEHLPISVSI